MRIKFLLVNIDLYIVEGNKGSPFLYFRNIQRIDIIFLQEYIIRSTQDRWQFAVSPMA